MIKITYTVEPATWADDAYIDNAIEEAGEQLAAFGPVISVEVQR